jgi:hypothetical protein
MRRFFAVPPHPDLYPVRHVSERTGNQAGRVARPVARDERVTMSLTKTLQNLYAREVNVTPRAIGTAGSASLSGTTATASSIRTS